MKTYMLALGVLLSVLAYTAQAETFSNYQEVYRNGLAQLQRGETRAAFESFYQAISLESTPRPGPDAYLPYVNLSIALFESGQTRAARDALIQSQVYGVAANTDEGRALLDRYAANIMSAPLDNSKMALLAPVKPTAKTAGPATAEPKSIPNTPDTVAVATAASVEADVIADNDSTVKRCAATINRSDDKLPWFFYYQCGVELMKAGNAEMAVSAFEMGANAHEDPRRGKRMYGMWFIDYLPYYQMALAHSQLGNWESANAAIKSSETYGEFSPGDPDYGSFSALDRLIKSNLKSNDS